MEYLTVGRSELKKKSIKPVKDEVSPITKSHIYKPTGGVWFTKYNSLYPGSNDWVDYLINNPDVLLYKNLHHDMWNQPCSIIGLKENSNIFNLDDYDKYNYLTRKFTLVKDMISYEKMSEVYDGVFVDICKLVGSSNEHIFKLVRQYAVTTLLLFNLEPIDYYYSGMVTIDPFDLDYYMENEGGFVISHDNIKRRIR